VDSFLTNTSAKFGANLVWFQGNNGIYFIAAPCRKRHAVILSTPYACGKQEDRYLTLADRLWQVIYNDNKMR